MIVLHDWKVQPVFHRKLLGCYTLALGKLWKVFEHVHNILKEFADDWQFAAQIVIGANLIFLQKSRQGRIDQTECIL